MIKTTWKITVTDTATYVIKAESLEDAKELAIEWFEERNPHVETSTTEEEPEYEIK